MDEYEREFNDFNWREIPAYKHPMGVNCPCPKHEFLREQVSVNKQINRTSKKYQPLVFRMCPQHYSVYFNEVIPRLPRLSRWMTKFVLKINALEIIKLSHMQSDVCFYCKYGAGGFDKKTELPPIR